jgi:light-independent protochlorophyllide reductase subunit L
VIANRSAATDQIDKFNAATGPEAAGALPRPRRDPRSRLKKSPRCSRWSLARAGKGAEGIHAAGRPLWAGTEPLEAIAMKDRDIFDLLGFD